MGTYKIGVAPPAQWPRVLLLGDIPQNTHRNKKGVVYIWGWDLSFAGGVEGKKGEGLLGVWGGGGEGTRLA
jgi:hypothetical protein